MALNWGIAGSGKICHDFVSALGSEPKHEHQVSLFLMLYNNCNLF